MAIIKKFQQFGMIKTGTKRLFHVGISIACEIVQISAGDHGPFSDQPFTIKNIFFCLNGRFKGLRLVSGLK